MLDFFFFLSRFQGGSGASPLHALRCRTAGRTHTRLGLVILRPPGAGGRGLMPVNPVQPGGQRQLFGPGAGPGLCEPSRAGGGQPAAGAPSAANSAAQVKRSRGSGSANGRAVCKCPGRGEPMGAAAALRRGTGWLRGEAAPGGDGHGRGAAPPPAAAPGPALPRGLAVPGGCSRGPAAPGRAPPAPPAGQGTQPQSRRERSGQRGSPFSLARPVRGHTVRVVADSRSAHPGRPGVLLRSGGAALCAAGCAGAAWL